jgi:hypothetical protein
MDILVNCVIIVPIIGPIIMIIESFIGKTLSGKPLKGAIKNIHRWVGIISLPCDITIIGGALIRGAYIIFKMFVGSFAPNLEKTIGDKTSGVVQK